MCFRKYISKILHFSLALFSKVLKKRGNIYMFHSVGDNRHKLNVSVSSFERFLQSLKKEKICRLENWEEFDDCICLTFDDVPDSFYYNAYPLLVRYSIPFTLFISLNLLDSESFLTTEMLLEIAHNPLCTVGSHGCKHQFYSSLSKDEIAEELLSSKRTLENLLNQDVELFAFPYGSFYASGFCNKKKVKDYYKYGFSTVASPISKPNLLPLYFLPRICVDEALIGNQ